jgi:mono/diheme cytochrome c family protein
VSIRSDWHPRIAVGAVASGIAGLLLIPTLAAAQTKDQAALTFTKDVAPILQRSCVSCHRPGQSAPMSLQTYEEVRPWARAIKTRVGARQMPPWHIDRTVGIQDFKNNRALPDKDVETILAWVDAGAPRGNQADMPPQRQFGDGDEWAIGKPDLVVRFPKYLVPVAGPDLFPNLIAATGLTEDRYIKAIETRPVGLNSRRVVHHAVAFMMDEEPANENGVASDAGMAESQLIVEYASGKAPEVYPANSGVLLKAGSTMLMQNHLHSVGEQIDSQVEMGFLLYPKGEVPKSIRYSTHHGDPTPNPLDSLDIPAGAVARVDGYTLHTKPGKIIAWQPHMHIRGKYQCLELIYPGNPSNVMKRETINCANWDYNWHSVYNYQDQVAPLVPAGTVIHIISWHDNSAANRNNPDPLNWVGYGDRTIDEMGFSWIGWIDLTPEEYEAELASRTAARKTTTTQQQQQQQN